MSTVLATAFAALVLSDASLRADTLDRVSISTAAAQMAPPLYTSKNWAGYAAESDFSNPVSNSVTAVSGSWIVPAVTPATKAGGQFSDCVAWVGIDGFDNNTVEQAGTASYILDGTTPVYAAWYEMYPAGMVTLTNRKYKVSRGDSVTASVQYDLPNYPDQFLLSITDNTSGWTFSISETSSVASRTSAEWIAEAPTYSGAIVPLPTFGRVTFTLATVSFGRVTSTPPMTLTKFATLVKLILA